MPKQKTKKIKTTIAWAIVEGKNIYWGFDELKIYPKRHEARKEKFLKRLNCRITKVKITEI